MAGLLGGVLPAIYSGADQLKRQIYGLLTNPNEMAQRASQNLLQTHAENQALMSKAHGNPQNPLQITDPTAFSELTNRYMAGVTGVAPIGMIAYHGTPHTIQGKFDISKVGTGEGAQAYGHGMYFAEARPVAEQYKVAGETIKYTPTLEKFTSGANYYIDDAGNYMKVRDWVKNDKPVSVPKEEYFQKFNEIKKMYESQPLGNLYKVDIPDEYIPKMLDWDKPLSQQPKEVIENLKKLNDPYINEAITTQPKISKDGEYWTYMGNTYGSKSEALNDAMPHKIITGYTGLGESPAEVSNMLNSVGIKGVKYLDQSSRGMTTGIGFNAPKYTAYDPNFGGHDFNSLKEAEEFVKNNPSFELLKPTSNFVVFDPTDVKILERNDKPIESLLGK